MAALEKALIEEYERVQKRLKQIDIELSELPKGYISEKNINNKTYYYLQRRENKKIVSEYIKSDDVAQMRRIIAYRKILEGERKNVLNEFDRVRKIFGIYTEKEKVELIREGIKAADAGETISAREAFNGVMKEINNAREIRNSNSKTNSKVD